MGDPDHRFGLSLIPTILKVEEFFTRSAPGLLDAHWEPLKHELMECAIDARVWGSPCDALIAGCRSALNEELRGGFDEVMAHVRSKLEDVAKPRRLDGTHPHDAALRPLVDQELSESELIAVIESHWPEGEGPVSWALLDLARRAASDFPDSLALNEMGADLISLAYPTGQMTDADHDEAIEMTRRAVELSPEDADPWESLGVRLDIRGSEEDLREAENCLRRAVALGAGEYCHACLARVIAQLGRRDEALRGLSSEACPYWDTDEVALRRDEILNGEWDPDEE